MKPGCVSIVIPIYNEEANLPELLRRCLEMGRTLDRAFEIVLVDDGSKDGSRQRLTAAAERDPAHVVAVLLNRNYGQHAAVMAGLAQTRGDIVVTLNGDVLGTFQPTGRILIYAQAGDDEIQLAGGITLPTLIDAGEGNDRIKGGNGPNVLLGGSG